jgi:hypothetical protein
MMQYYLIFMLMFSQADWISDTGMPNEQIIMIIRIILMLETTRANRLANAAMSKLIYPISRLDTVTKEGRMLF